MHVSGEPTAGEKLTVELSSLNYTSEGEPMAKTATVSLGEATAEAEIDNARQDGDDQMGERGRATVELTVPEDLSGEQELKVTTDQGTEVIIPVAVAAHVDHDDLVALHRSGRDACGRGDASIGAIHSVTSSLQCSAVVAIASLLDLTRTAGLEPCDPGLRR